MNERIKELMDQATSRMPGRPPYDSLAFDVFDKEKFAELIVNECCKRLSDETILHDGYGYNQHFLYEKLRNHFGVKE